jgi:N-acetylglucosaminyldiphosphoundecaprenol N-acetyl-beta-D-mannosaminyltransferase
MKSVDILGVRVDKVTMDEATDQIKEWIGQGGRHYIVTPNVEMIMASRKDRKFKSVLNGADLAIPDSARIGWAYDILQEKNLFLKLLKWPLFILPKNSLLTQFDIVTGTDLMESLLKHAEDWGVTVGFLGGQKKLAEALRERLEKKYPKLEISFQEDGGVIDNDGNQLSKSGLEIPKTDILFVAFGHIKQEKWIAKNLSGHPVKVMIGVGGAFDYLSGHVPRASSVTRKLGFEWLYRLIQQPWRIKRFGPIFEFVFLVPFE